MRLFQKKGIAVKNWRNRALMINFRTTHLTIIEDQDYSPNRKVPAWVYEEFVGSDS